MGAAEKIFGIIDRVPAMDMRGPLLPSDAESVCAGGAGAVAPLGGAAVNAADAARADEVEALVVAARAGAGARAPLWSPSRPFFGRIDLQGVHFHYPSRPEAQVLEDFNLTLYPGQVSRGTCVVCRARALRRHVLFLCWC